MAQLKLNKIEKLKRSLRPIDYYEKIASLDPSRLSEADRFYLKNFGIYNHKLAPGRFTLRIRVPGGRIATEAFGHLRSAAGAMNAPMVVTARAQLEVHGLTLPQAWELSRSLERWGLTSWQTYTDNFRNIVTHPLDGLTEGCAVEVYDLIVRMQRVFLKVPDFVGEIPRKFNVGISGCREQLFSLFGNDLAFVLARREGVTGFNLYVGGKNSETARSLNLFVTPEAAVAAFEAVATLYRDEGPRQSRSRARLFHMLETLGIDAFRRKVLDRLPAAFAEAGELRVEKVRPSRETALRDGSVALRYTTRFGELDGAAAEEICELCERHGVGTIRLGCDQNIYLPRLPAGVRFRHETKRYAGIVTCVGSRYCVYSLADTKAESAALSLRKCGELNISVGFSGCLKGCARHAFSDIGLVGIRTKLFAEAVERGVRLYLGAEYTRGKRAGRLVLYSVPMRHLDAMIDLIADLFAAGGYDDFEEYAAEVINRYSEPALAFWLLLNFYRRHRLGETSLFLLEAENRGDEKAWFIRRLEEEGEVRNRELIEYLRCQEAFPFREAIIFLERACFSVKSPS